MDLKGFPLDDSEGGMEMEIVTTKMVTAEMVNCP